MHAIFNHAIRWEWHSHNPITHVRQSAKRSRIPVVLSIAQVQALLENLREPVRTMVLVDVSTGLRISELLALQWRDVDFENLEISVTRSISDSTSATAKQKHHASRYRWMSKSPSLSGGGGITADTRPRMANSRTDPALCIGRILRLLQRLRVFPARSAGTRFATLLKANGEDVKTVEELLRHATSAVTMNVYAQGVTEPKRKAHHRIVRMVIGGKF